LATTSAIAQTAPQPKTPQAGTVAAAGQPEVDAVIVTAQKREERIQDVPIAITVVTGDALARTGAKNMTELQGIAPGIYISGNSGYAGSPISIRGTAGTNSTLLDDPVAVYVNGVYQSSGTFGGNALVDIGSVQVVRGPQGTLQGRNATAGAVLIETANPGTSLGGYMRASYADPSEFRAEAAIGGPLSDTLGARVAVGYYDEKGWGKNTFDNQRIGGGRGFSARGTLRWRPTSDLDVRLVVGHVYTYAEPALARYAATPFNPSPTGPLILPGTATPTTPLTSAQLNALDNDQYALNRPTYNRTTDDSIALNLTYSIGKVDLVSVTGYDKVDLDGASDSDGLARTDREGFNSGTLPAKNFSEELRLQSNDNGRFSWILGAYYSSAIQDMDFLIDNLQLSVADRRVTRYVANQDTRSYAGFADATFHITPKIAIIGGARYTRETKDFAFDRTISNYDTGASIAPLFQYRPDQAVFTNTSYRVKATYQPTTNILLYASYSTGFKSGGFNAFGSDPAFNPEELKSAEMGVKADLLDRRATVALAVYSNKYDNLQVRVGVPAGGIAITNAADSKIDGFELEGTLRPRSDLSFTGNVAYTNARFSDFPLARNLLDQGPFDASGNKLPRTPEWQYYLQGSYTPQLSDTMTGLLEVSYRWRDRIYLYQTDQTSPTVQGKPVGELGLRAGVTLQPSQISITAFATNLTNERSVNGANITFSYPEVSFNKPRVIGVQIEKKF
jgi:iron complex outermembrane receptor protein